MSIFHNWKFLRKYTLSISALNDGNKKQTIHQHNVFYTLFLLLGWYC